MTWFRSKFEEFLKDEVIRLNRRVEELEEEKKELIKLLVPGLKKKDLTAHDIVENRQKHTLTRDKDFAKCSCGWEFISKDPGELQTAISGHFRNNIQKLRTRKSWPEIKQAAEDFGV